MSDLKEKNSCNTKELTNDQLASTTSTEEESQQLHFDQQGNPNINQNTSYDQKTIDNQHALYQSNHYQQTDYFPNDQQIHNNQFALSTDQSTNHFQDVQSTSHLPPVFDFPLDQPSTSRQVPYFSRHHHSGYPNQLLNPHRQPLNPALYFPPIGQHQQFQTNQATHQITSHQYNEQFQPRGFAHPSHHVEPPSWNLASNSFPNQTTIQQPPNGTQTPPPPPPTKRPRGRPRSSTKRPKKPTQPKQPTPQQHNFQSNPSVLWNRQPDLYFPPPYGQMTSPAVQRTRPVSNGRARTNSAYWTIDMQPPPLSQHWLHDIDPHFRPFLTNLTSQLPVLTIQDSDFY